MYIYIYIYIYTSPVYFVLFRIAGAEEVGDFGAEDVELPAFLPCMHA